jgi:hypothetical protein
MLNRLAEWSGINGEWLVTIALCLVVVAGYGIAAAGVSDWHDVAGLFKGEDVGARLRRECESIIREAWPNASDSTKEIRVRLCVDERGRNGK